MDMIINSKDYKGRPASAISADGRYSWTTFQEHYLTDTVLNLSIYQMRYCTPNGVDSTIPPQRVEEIREFWDKLYAATQKAEKEYDKKELDKIMADHAIYVKERYMPHITGDKRRVLAQQYNDVVNEGGDGYNPWIE